MSLNIEVFGFLAAILTTTAYVPQAVKIFKTKEVNDVSLSMYLIMLLGICLWFYYGFKLGSLSMIVSNIITGLIVVSILIFKIRYSRK